MATAIHKTEQLKIKETCFLGLPRQGSKSKELWNFYKFYGADIMDTGLKIFFSISTL